MLVSCVVLTAIACLVCGVCLGRIAVLERQNDYAQKSLAVVHDQLRDLSFRLLVAEGATGPEEIPRPTLPDQVEEIPRPTSRQK